jgi:hypothetical protein
MESCPGFAVFLPAVETYIKIFMLSRLIGDEFWFDTAVTFLAVILDQS